MAYNIIFYFSDQQRWDTCGCFGQPLNVTPNLDKLAEEGVKFDNAFSPQPVCGPCRALFQTGKYPTETGCFRNNLMLPSNIKTLGEYMEKDAGYETAYVGKWHLASDGELEKKPTIDHTITAVPLEYVRRYTRQYGTEFEVTVFADGVDILEDYRAVYDIIFLDVEMKHLDGMTTAERIRQMDADVILIFITNMAQYAIRGYSVGALDYVLKPVPYFAFSQQLLKAVARLEKRAKHYLTVPVEGGLRRLDTASIYYLESEGHRVHFYTDEGDFSAPGALKAFEEKLADCPFARCNSGYLVNLAQVRELRQSTVQVGPCELQVSRPKRKAFLAALTDYIGGEGS